MLVFCTVQSIQEVLFSTIHTHKTALLNPPDKPKQECLGELRQAGPSLLSGHFAESLQEQAEIKHTYKGFGRPYKELRGKGKATFMRLPTGAVRVKAKTDCWLTYNEYLKLTE